ncbi:MULTISPECIES: hypothetical protein [unclassified Pseudonocardia]|jgi:hypothetical protein|uniref:hypothetical protein n=2 Tax=Pseudonocardia TaxID=1847 RepID=UPI002607523E|nr:hypothetical protein [Pseudonocardia sp.]MCU1628536.1 hypothetical protein [Pseudonocardia sp.]MDT7699610.1 hypothetical protein [Pseudonocardiales bacterium]
MSWARHGRATNEDGTMGNTWSEAQAAYQESCDTQNGLAARVVAGQATDLEDCTELLAMLGLDARAGRPA